jgi:hypothetical protein
MKPIPKTPAERKAKQRALQPMKLRPRKRGTSLTVPYNLDDCRVQGIPNTLSSIIEVKASLLQKIVGPCAGLGVFATEYIPKGSYVTEYAGTIKAVRPHDITYCYELFDKSYLDGIRNPSHGKGVGSLVNRCSGKKKDGSWWNRDPNVRFHEEHDKRVYVISLRNIKAGTELLARYGKTYQIKY